MGHLIRASLCLKFQRKKKKKRLSSSFSSVISMLALQNQRKIIYITKRYVLLYYERERERECECERKRDKILLLQIYILYLILIAQIYLTELRILLFSDTMTRKYIFLMTGVSIRAYYFFFSMHDCQLENQ